MKKKIRSKVTYKAGTGATQLEKLEAGGKESGKDDRRRRGLGRGGKCQRGLEKRIWKGGMTG